MSSLSKGLTVNKLSEPEEPKTPEFVELGLVELHELEVTPGLFLLALIHTQEGAVVKLSNGCLQKSLARDVLRNALEQLGDPASDLPWEDPVALPPVDIEPALVEVKDEL